MDAYERMEKLGQGAYGVVSKAKHKGSGDIVAVKKISIDRDEGVPAAALKEITALRSLKHPNIVTLRDVLTQGSQNAVYLIFEHCDQDLHGFLNNCHGVIDQGLVRKLMKQLLSGVAFCHDENILHRDLKPQNLLLTKSMELKIADFGLAKIVKLVSPDCGPEWVEELSTAVVTLWYRPPDVMLGNSAYSASIDMWSVGCIFAELASAGKPLFPGKNEEQQLDLIFKLLGTPTKKSWPGFSELAGKRVWDKYKTVSNWPEQVAPKLPKPGWGLLHSLLQCNPTDRMDANKALDHKYFHQK